MSRRLLSLLLLGMTCVNTVVVAQSDRSPRWRCVVQGDAQSRKQRVEREMLPNVVFIGETAPVAMDRRMLAHKVPALSVAVIRQGQLDWSAAWGYRWTGGPSADCSTLFQAASLAKPVTLLAALRLEQAGLLEFDKNVDAYLTSYRLPPGRQTDEHPVTLGNLFAHTSGITPGGYAGYAQGDPIPSDQQVVRGEAPSNSPKVDVRTVPDESLAYSGGGYTVAEIALQDLLRLPFAQIMHDWLLGPFGMRQADFRQPLPAGSQATAARGHLADGQAVAGGWKNHPEQAAAGLWATASDLAIFLIEIEKGSRGQSQLLTQGSIRKLLSKPVDGHAYGFQLLGDGADTFITHYGANAGYRAGMTLNLRTGDGAVFLTNSDGGSDLGDEFLASVSRVYGWTAFREARVTRSTQPPDVLQSLAGRYVFVEQKWAVSVVFEASALTIVFPNGDRYSMTPIQGAPLEFIHAVSGVRVTFEGEDADRRIRLYGQTGRRRPTGR